MEADLQHLGEPITAGVASGDFHAEDPTAAAIQILALVDGLSVQAAVRATLQYTAVEAMVRGLVGRVLGLAPAPLHDSRI